MKKIILIKFLLLLFVQHIGFAQQDAQFSQFMFNKLFLNPAFAGVEGLTQVSLIHRTQWLGYSGSFDEGGTPNTQVLSFTTGFPKYNSGIGVHIVNDNLGPLNNLEVQLSYAYHVNLRNNAKLSFGLRGGIYNKTIAFDRLRFRQEGDIYDIDTRDASLKPDFALGTYYYSKNFYLGISANHLIKVDFNFGNITEKPLANSYYLMGGYHYQINNEFKVTPSFLVKSSEFNEISFDVGALVTYKEKIWLGGTYRNEESANAIIGMVIPNKNKNSKNEFKIGYSFDYVILGQTAKQATSHEIFLSYSLPVPIPKYPSIIRTPRFRY